MTAKASGRSAVQGTTDMSKVEPFLQTAAAEVSSFEKKVNETKVTSADLAESAGTLGRTIAEKVESLERQRKEFVDPLNQHVKLINARFKSVTEPLARILHGLKDKIGAYHAEQRRIADVKAQQLKAETDLEAVTTIEALEAQFAYRADAWAKVEAKDPWAKKMLARYRERRTQLKRYEKKVEKAAETGKAPPPPPKTETPSAPVVPAEPERRYGGTQIRMRWVHKLVDITAVPVEFLQLNDTEVRAHIQKQVRAKETPQIPGLLIEQKENVAV